MRRWYSDPKAERAGEQGEEVGTRLWIRALLVLWSTGFLRCVALRGWDSIG